MSQSILIPLIFSIALVIGIVVGYFLSKLKLKASVEIIKAENLQLKNHLEDIKNQHSNTLDNLNKTNSEGKILLEKHLSKIETERDSIRKEKDFLSTELATRNSEFENLAQKNSEQKQEVEKLQERFSKEFENLANKIFDQKSEKFTLMNKENIQNILNPLGEKIKSFEQKVDKNNTDFIQRHAQLGEQLLHLNKQNLKISEEAINLTKALKGDNKMQGNWGEMVLERVLERSGLQKDSEYFVQQNFHNENGKRVMPDVVIHLPGDKKMIIDSKVSLNAYERYMNDEDDFQKGTHLKNHVISVKKRVEELGAKNYHSLYQMESPDFVLLFIPIEAAFAVASNNYPHLYNDAFDKNIIIVTPTTLLAVLKTIDSMWQNEKQKQNAIDIATQAGALYDSFTNLTEDLLKVGKQIGTVQNTYDTAMKKLTGKGNLIRKVERLKKLGAKASKQLDTKLLSQSQEDLDENMETKDSTLNSK
ncbi:DNA recombination protein RmuC [Gillisia mitskevichiae]|uniref:DNA recombination protein RmuC n=1 Tax=Gillisia mitskevichiae TaxID=270921 RepID=A0A495PTK1_9FLAO|nr:DNA recombination protein RmuC [Gillisia mitskevichiae]RKS53296.1 DNA recombination protein RmuC [Gillisia mitskevichiae]